MKRMAICLAAFAALAAEAATYSRMEVDVSPLPADRAFFRRVLLSRVWSRTPASSAGRTLTVRLSLDDSLSGENAAVRVADGVAEVRGGRFRALVFGAGLLLRTIR